MEILKIISGPILGSIIGYGTNLLAIKMLFRPYREIKIVGRCIPFTPGIIPKRKPEIAKAVGNVVGNELFTKEDILKSLMNEEVQNNLVQKILDKLYSNDKTISENLITLTDEEKYKFTKNSLIEEITTKIQNAILNINLGEIISKEAKIAVKEQVSNPLIKMFLNDNMIDNFVGPIENRVKDYIQTSGKEVIKNAVESETKNIENLRTPELLNKFNLDEEKLNNIIKNMYNKFLKLGIDKLLENIDISTIVEEKINEMKIEDLEKLILKIMKKELNAIVNLGALLGFLIGLLNIIFVL